MRSRLTLLALGAPAILIVAGLVYENAAGWMALRRHPAPGRLVDVGGHRLHLRCEGTGETTVVLEAGAANGSLSWYKVVPEIARFTRVCAYDRAGHGWSDTGPRPRLPSTIAGELRALLNAAGLRPPYVIVGHSLGGLYARMFATRHAADVAGVVLVDASHTDQHERLPPALGGEGGKRKLQHRMMGSSVGVPRLFGWEFCGGGPPAIREQLYATECGARFYRTLRDEMGGDVGTPQWNEAAREVAGLGSLGTMPLTVLTADPDRPIPGVVPAHVEPELRKILRVEMQQDLARLSSNSRLVIAKDSGHMVPFDRPDVIADAVRAMVER